MTSIRHALLPGGRLYRWFVASAALILAFTAGSQSSLAGENLSRWSGRVVEWSYTRDKTNVTNAKDFVFFSRDFLWRAELSSALNPGASKEVWASDGTNSFQILYSGTNSVKNSASAHAGDVPPFNSSLSAVLWWTFVGHNLDPKTARKFPVLEWTPSTGTGSGYIERDVVITPSSNGVRFAWMHDGSWMLPDRSGTLRKTNSFEYAAGRPRLVMETGIRKGNLLQTGHVGDSSLMLWDSSGASRVRGRYVVEVFECGEENIEKLVPDLAADTHVFDYRGGPRIPKGGAYTHWAGNAGWKDQNSVTNLLRDHAQHGRKAKNNTAITTSLSIISAVAIGLAWVVWRKRKESK